MLADVGSPLKLADGTLVYKDGRIVSPEQAARRQTLVEIPTNSEARALVVRTRRQLADLPAPPKTMHPIAVILTYELFGLTVDEIAVALGTSVDRVQAIQASAHYATMKSQIVDSVLKEDAENVRNMFQQRAKTAVTALDELLISGKQEVRLAVAKDFLDRGGHRPADVHEHRISMEGELIIKYIEPDASPTIDVTLDMDT